MLARLKAISWPRFSTVKPFVLFSLGFSSVAFFSGFIITPVSKVMGVDLTFDQVFPFVKVYGFFFLVTQLRLLLEYFCIWFFLSFGVDSFFTLIKKKQSFWWVQLISFVIYGLLLWSSIGRNPQLYHDALFSFSENLAWPLVFIFQFISPHWFYYLAWFLILLSLLFLALRLAHRARILSYISGLYKRYITRGALFRFGLVAILLLAGLITWVALSRPVPHKGRLHIWLAIDSLRYHELQETSLLKNLRSMAEEQGVLLPHHHVTLPRTLPAFTSMLTGLYPAQSGVKTMFPPVEALQELSQKPNVVSYLKSKGYKTAVVGDYAADFFSRLNLPFDENVTPSLDMKAMIRFQSLKSQAALMPFLANKVLRHYHPEIRALPEFAIAEYIIEDAMNVIEAFQPADDVFLVVFLGTAHFPYSPPWPYYLDHRTAGYTGKYLFKKFIDPFDSSEPAEHEKKQVRNLFKASLKSIDDSIGRFSQYLESKSAVAGPLVYVFGDHGENLYEKLGDGPVYQGHGEHLRGSYSVKTPWIIHWGKNQGGRFDKVKKTSVITSQVDMFSTTADLLFAEKIDTAGIPVSKLSGWGNRMVMLETGLWFSDSGEFTFQNQRMMYPDFTNLSAVEHDGSLVVREHFRSSVEMAKFRAVAIQSGQQHYRLVFRPQIDRGVYQFYKVGPGENDGWQQQPCINLCQRARLFLATELKSNGYYYYDGRYFAP